MRLTILCVTAGAAYARPFLMDLVRVGAEVAAEVVLHTDRSGQGYLEAELPTALADCTGDYVLRIDDDERCSASLVEWLKTKEYESAAQWWFPRAHLWGNDRTVLTNFPLWPDQQTRLTTRDLVVREAIHAGSAGGRGAQGDGVIEHHKFLVRSHAERLALANHYEGIRRGAGSGKFKPFQTPEDCYPQDCRVTVPLVTLC